MKTPLDSLFCPQICIGRTVTIGSVPGETLGFGDHTNAERTESLVTAAMFGSTPYPTVPAQSK